MIEKFCVWYLRKKKRSIIMNFDITNGKVQPKENRIYLYDNDLDVDEYLNTDGEKLCLPRGKFKLETYKGDE